MSLIKLAGATQYSISRDERQHALGQLGGVKGFVAQYHHDAMQNAGQHVTRIKKEIANLTPAQKATGHAAVLEKELHKHIGTVQEHSAKLRTYTHPTGEAGQSIASRIAPSVEDRAKKVIKNGNAGNVTSKGTASTGSKVLNFVKNNKVKAGLIGAGVAAAGYGVKKLLEKKQDQPRYYQAG